ASPSPVRAPPSGSLRIPLLFSLEQALVDPAPGPLRPVRVGGIACALGQSQRRPSGGFLRFPVPARTALARLRHPPSSAPARGASRAGPLSPPDAGLPPSTLGFDQAA